MLLRRARRVADHLQDGMHRGVRPFQGGIVGEALPRIVRPSTATSVSPRICILQPRLFTARTVRETLVDYARKHGVTRLFLNRDAKSPRRWFPGLDFTDQVLQQAREMEVTVVAERSRHGLAASPYPEDEAGALMHAGYVRISADITVEEAIAGIRQQAEQVEMIYYAYVLDESQHLRGVVSFRELLSAERSRKSS